MRRDPTTFRERFKKWKETGEYNLPHFKDGLEDELYTNYPIPFVKDKEVALTNAGLATGARLSTNMLDSIADNAVKAGLPIKTAIGLAVKESTLGNPTDDRSIYKIVKPSVAKRFKLLGTGQHINTKGDLVFGDELINYYVNENNKWPNGWQGEDTYYPSTLYMGFKYFKNNPRKYNPGQKNHVLLVDRRAEETWKSPEVLNWFNDYNKRKTEYLKRPEPYKVATDWNRVNPLLKESKFNLPKFTLGTEGDDIDMGLKKNIYDVKLVRKTIHEQPVSNTDPVGKFVVNTVGATKGAKILGDIFAKFRLDRMADTYRRIRNLSDDVLNYTGKSLRKENIKFADESARNLFLSGPDNPFYWMVDPIIAGYTKLQANPIIGPLIPF